MDVAEFAAPEGGAGGPDVRHLEEAENGDLPAARRGVRPAEEGDGEEQQVEGRYRGVAIDICLYLK